MYAKAHPFGYIKQKTRKKKDVANGRQITQVQTIRLNNGQIKNIFHVNPKVKGSTFAENVYDSMLNNPNYNEYMKRFAANH